MKRRKRSAKIRVNDWVIVESLNMTVLDEWIKEFDGYEFVFQIKTASHNHSIWYPVTFWREEYPQRSFGGKFDVCPDRKQVEEYFSKNVANYIETWLSENFLFSVSKYGN